MASGESNPLPTIDCKANGPYLVNGLTTFANSRGEAIATKEIIALCRCGASNNKPFCDGTHAKIGFEDSKQPGRTKDKRSDYVGKTITIHDNRGLCAHAGVCTDRLSSVWRMGVEPWIDPDGASVEAIVEAIEACPSGALSYTINDEEHRDCDNAPAIHLAKNGPYVVTGGISLEDVAFGEGVSREHFTLCRCGASKNKPFCDGSHYDAGFEHDEG
jgi:CDGSH-type Zn-finger protein